MQNSQSFHAPNNSTSREFWFGVINSRPLSAFRICFALLLLKDALYHLPIASIFYGDHGVLPRLVLWDRLATLNQFSLMDALSDDWMVALFFIIWAGVAVCLLVGYRTRLMSILNFIIVLSVHQRDVYVLTGADTVLRVLSFWMMFLPLDQYYSLDSLMRAGHDSRTAYAFPLRMIQLQVALVYLVTGILKLMGSPWRSGDAVYTVLQINTMLLPSGQWLGANAPYWFLQLITYSVVGTELAFIVLIFAPFAQPKLKAVALALGAIFHLAIALTMVMPMTDFSLVMLISYLLFFEPQWIERIDKKARQFISPILTRLSRSQRLGHVLRYATGILKGSVKPDDVSPSSSKFRRIALTLCLTGMMILVLWWNLSVISGYADRPFLPDYPAWSTAIIHYTGLWQYWDMFAPVPLQVDGWIRIPGQFENGTHIDLFDPQATDSSTLPPAIKWGPDMRWQKYVSNIYDDQNDNLLRAWGRYYCWLYNTSGNLPTGARLATLEIHFMYRRVHKYGEAPSPLQDDLLWSHWCLDEYAPK